MGNIRLELPRFLFNYFLFHLLAFGVCSTPQLKYQILVRLLYFLICLVWNEIEAVVVSWNGVGKWVNEQQVSQKPSFRIGHACVTCCDACVIPLIIKKNHILSSENTACCGMSYVFVPYSLVSHNIMKLMHRNNFDGLVVLVYYVRTINITPRDVIWVFHII